MSRLTGRAAAARRRAAANLIQAKRCGAGDRRTHHVHLAAEWLEIAQSFEEAERISGFLAWDAQRLKPPEAA